MELNDFIKPELIIVIPVLCYLGTVLKQSELISNKNIPIVLTVISILICGLYLSSSMDINTTKHVTLFLFSSVTQGSVIGFAACGSYESLRHLKK